MKKQIWAIVCTFLSLLLCIPSTYANQNENTAYEAYDTLMAYWTQKKEGIYPFYYPEDIGGTYMTSDNKLAIMIIKPTEKRKEELRKLSGHPNLIVFVECKYSYTELSKLADSFNEKYKSKYSYFLANDMQMQNKVVIEVYEKDYATVKSLFSKYGDKVSVEISDGPEKIDVPAPMLDPEDTAIATYSCNVYKGPSTSYAKLGILIKGMSVVVEEYTSTEWTKITFNGKTGYVETKHLTLQNISSEVTPSAIGSAIAKANVNVRAGAGTKYEKIGSLTKGQTIAVTGISNDWGKIAWQDGEAYVHINYLKISSISLSAVATANVNVRTGMGTKYKKLGSLAKGQAVTVLSIDSKWTQIEWDGMSGYVYITYLRFA